MQTALITRLLCATALWCPIAINAQVASDAAVAPAAVAAAAPASGPVTGACEARPGSPPWVPCGADRTLSEAEVRALILKEPEGLVTKIAVTSGTSGKKYFIHFRPGGKLDSGLEGGRNVGKSWKFENGRLCRDYYAPATGVHCGVFEVSGGVLYLEDLGDARKSAVTAMEHAKP